MLSGYTSKVDYDNTDPDRYKIEIDLINQVISVYERDGLGNYTGLVLQGLCTTGNEENPTGAGTYKLGQMKERFGYFVAFGQYAQYWTQVVRGIYIHSIMYDAKDLTKLSKSAYNGLGKNLSHGCVRVLPEHAKWIFYNCPPGTTCQITKNRAADPALVKALKNAKPSFKSLYNITDYKADPMIMTATLRSNSVPLRTGFSTSKDTTVATLNYGDQVKVLQIASDWCKVETAKGKLGYVKTTYLQFDPDGTANRIQYSYTAKSDTALYQTAHTDAKQLLSIPKGTEIPVINTRDRFWYTATINGVTGYVRSRYVTAREGAAYPIMPEEPTFESGATATIKEGIIANFRSGPGTAYPVIGEYMGGTAVTLLDLNGSWYYADINGQMGYLSVSCLTFG